MPMTDHPLRDIFSEDDLERLKNGRCVETGGVADTILVRKLTENYDHPNSYSVSLAEWLRQAALHGNGVCERYRAQLRRAVSDRKRFFRVAGELMAAHFLEVQLGFHLRYVPRRETPTPDFEIQKNGLVLKAEVKTVVGKSARAATAIRSAIDVVRKRKQYSADGNNLVLLVNWWDPGIPRRHAIDALYGDSELAASIGPGGVAIGPWRWVRWRNVLCQFNKNTWISAVGFLGWPGRPDCAGYFIHNCYSYHRIPAHMFDPWSQFVPDEANERMIWRNLPDGR